MQKRLFREHGELSDYLEKRRTTLKEEIENSDRNYLLNVSEQDFIAYLIKKYSIQAPQIDESGIYIADEKEKKILVREDPMWAGLDNEGPQYAKGIAITIAIPFTGDGDLFDFQPSSRKTSPPRGEIVGQEVHLIYERIDHNAEVLKQEYVREIAEIKWYLENVNREVTRFNESLEPFAREIVRRRKEKILRDAGLISNLGLPVRKREDAPKTYAIPEIRKKVVLGPPPASEKSFKPEPAFEMSLYEHALDIIKGMVHVMERSPKAFAHMGEEDIRQHFLVQLNGQYEGLATGETFNYEGKTDILIRKDDKNVFIAECKFWKGEKGLSEAIDQILGYTSWRDTKTAIILFNRGKNFSAVLEKIPGIIKAHGCFKRDEGRRGETEYRFIFHQPDDVNRELILTVMAFNVPAPEKARPIS